ncbi:MAG: hypothetical protein DF168_00332 [Candidatus Moanabacter tarae]|uniref:N-acetyltransferase domain-containing protein n=1 Tax=Candidatus Moanibacter tarae TaxID=2200854 RepID=A0A2Z4ANQ3_9BACT|nr:MAG: hypothetical protein DF168_00332 [Candidatus Moanabacter tarae]|tara:strand:- start:3817 stop:4704 length:888 start_codon:yes stop_codon:yes gene_type:complete
MPSFRFCRPDDSSLLIEATNQAFNIHFPRLVPITEEKFKREIKELDLWTSSCVLASEDGKPIGVLIAAKREEAATILRLGVVPRFQGHGYGSHLVASLKDKMSVLGPALLTVEITENQAGLITFFQKLGFELEDEYYDFMFQSELEESSLPELVSEIGVDDLGSRFLHSSDGEFQVGEGFLAWMRQTQTIINQKNSVRGLGIPDLDGFAAYLYYREIQGSGACEGGSYVEIVAIGCRIREKATILCGILIRYLLSQIQSRILVPRLSKSEISYDILEEIGFVRGARILRYGVGIQ